MSTSNCPAFCFHQIQHNGNQKRGCFFVWPVGSSMALNGCLSTPKKMVKLASDCHITLRIRICTTKDRLNSLILTTSLLDLTGGSPSIWVPGGWAAEDAKGYVYAHSHTWVSPNKSARMKTHKSPKSFFCHSWSLESTQTISLIYLKCNHLLMLNFALMG